MISFGREYNIFFKTYHCNLCKKTFQGYDARALKFLPKEIQNRFPAIVNRKTAIDKRMAWLLHRQIVKCQSFKDFRRMCQEMSAREYWNSFSDYKHMAVRNKKEPSLTKSPRKIDVMGPIDDRNGWWQLIPSERYLRGTFMNMSNDTLPYKVRSMMQITGNLYVYFA